LACVCALFSVCDVESSYPFSPVQPPFFSPLNFFLPLPSPPPWLEFTFFSVFSQRGPLRSHSTAVLSPVLFPMTWKSYIFFLLLDFPFFPSILLFPSFSSSFFLHLLPFYVCLFTWNLCYHRSDLLILSGIFFIETLPFSLPFSLLILFRFLFSPPLSLYFLQ